MPNTYTEKDILALEDIITKLRIEFQAGRKETLPKIYRELFHGKMIVLPQRMMSGRLKMYRIVPYSKMPDRIEDCSYNPAGNLSRCNLQGNPTFYGSNDIFSALAETIFHTTDEYLYNYNAYVGKKFVLGEWHLDLNWLSIISFLYGHKMQNSSPTILKYNQEMDEVLARRSADQICFIKRLISLYREIFCEDHIISSNLGNEVLMRHKVGLIIYPSTIENLDAVNFAFSKNTADNKGIFKPVKFNYCELCSRPLGYENTDFFRIRYDFAGLPILNENQIVWSNNQNSMKELEIEGLRPKFSYLSKSPF